LEAPVLELAFHVRLDFADGPRTRFDPAGKHFTRGFVGLAGGEVSGPRLAGTVVPHSGGDWPRIWDSGLIEFEAHYMLEADDGTPIYIRNRGYLYNTQPGAPGPAYFRCTPYFRAPVGRHDWLNRTVIVGGGERHSNPDHTLFRYFSVD
jgi:hypothetical protein